MFFSEINFTRELPEVLLASFDKSGFLGKVLSWEKSSGITHPKLSVQELQFKFWSQVEKRLQQLHYANHLQMRENINAVDWFVFRNVNKIYSWTEKPSHLGWVGRPCRSWISQEIWGKCQSHMIRTEGATT